MTKIVAIMTAGCFALSTACASEPGSAGAKAQNENAAFRMACTVPTLSFQLNDQQRQNWATAMAEHHKTGCTVASEAKLLARAKEILTPEQFQKFKEKYQSGPKMKM